MKQVIEKIEEKMLDFCFKGNCIYYNPERPNICKLVVDAQNQEPIDYCPVVKFLNWLKTLEKEES